MKAILFDGTEIYFSGNDVKEITIEYGDYSLLITFNELYSRQTGYTTERASSIEV